MQAHAHCDVVHTVVCSACTHTTWYQNDITQHNTVNRTYYESDADTQYVKV